MVFTPIPDGTLNWDVPLNAALQDLQDQFASVGYQYLVAASGAPASVKAKTQYVCDGTADEVQIQAAVDSAFAAGGGIVRLSSGIFSTASPITLHPTVTLVGAHGDQIFNPDQLTVQSYLSPSAGFTGGAVIVMLGETAGGYADKSSEQRIFHLTIDGSTSAADVHGIQASDYIHGVVLRDVAVKNVTGKGIYTFTENGAQPFSWTFNRVVIDNSTGVGIHLINHSDCTMIDVVSIGAAGNNYTLSNMPNSRLIGCRAEWSDATGFHITGNFGTGQGSGGMTMVGCSTDRNGFDGLLVDATGNAPIQIQDHTARRDGRNNNAGGGGYAGVQVTDAEAPVIISSLVSYPGIDDTGAGVNSPDYGLSVSGSTYVALSAGFLHAEVNGWNDGGGNTILRRGPNIGERTGSTAAPVDAFAEPWGTAGNASISGYTVLDAGQSNGVWNIFDGSDSALNLGSAGGGISIAEGANARMGRATLVGGTVTVANTSVTATSEIFLTCQTPGGTPGFLHVSARTAATSFTILSSSGADTSVVGWVIFEPA